MLELMPLLPQPRLTSISWRIPPCRALAACLWTGLSLVGARHVIRSRAVIGREPAGVAACVGGLLSARPEPELSEAQRAVRSVGGQTVRQSDSQIVRVEIERSNRAPGQTEGGC